MILEPSGCIQLGGGIQGMVNNSGICKAFSVLTSCVCVVVGCGGGSWTWCEEGAALLRWGLRTEQREETRFGVTQK